MKKFIVLTFACFLFTSCLLDDNSGYYPPDSINIQKTNKPFWTTFERHGIKYLMYHVNECIFIMEDK